MLVDGYLVAHAPGGMPEGLRRCDVLELLTPEAEERSAGGCEQYLLYLVAPLARETLEDSRVLAVDGQQRCLVLRYQGVDHLAGSYERLLVGQRDDLAGLDGPDRRFQPSKADQRHKHYVHITALYHIADGL